MVESVLVPERSKCSFVNTFSTAPVPCLFACAHRLSRARVRVQAQTSDADKEESEISHVPPHHAHRRRADLASRVRFRRRMDLASGAGGDRSTGALERTGRAGHRPFAQARRHCTRHSRTADARRMAAQRGGRPAADAKRPRGSPVGAVRETAILVAKLGIPEHRPRHEARLRPCSPRRHFLTDCLTHDAWRTRLQARQHRHASRSRDRGHGHRSCAGLFQLRWRGGSDGQSRHRRRALLYALDHALLRTGVRVSRGHERRLDDVAQDAVSVGRVPVQARRVADFRRVVCRCHRLELCAVGNRAARWARRRCDAGDMGHRREHGRLGGRAVPWTARVSHHRRCDPRWSQSARSDMASHERHLRHRPSMVGGVARPDGNREWTVLSS